MTMKTIVIVRQVIDTTGVRKINPSWPDRIIQSEGPAELRGEKLAIWRDGNLVGYVGHDGWEVVA
jgi:hypothetical protein